MIEQEIISSLQKALQKLGVENSTPQLEIPSDPTHGDYSSNVAFVLSKELKKAPMEIAQDIISNFKFQISNPTESDSNFKYFEKIEAVNPGFINFTLSKEYLISNLNEVLKDSDKLIKTGRLANRKILVEYAHPNTHKEMHIGHMRTLITGEAICRLLESQGAEVFRANYQGDIGPHVAKALYGIEKIMQERGVSLEKIGTWSNYDKAHFLGEGYVRGNQDYDVAKEKIDQINGLLYTSVTKNKLHTSLQGDLINLYKTTRKWSLDYYAEFYKRFLTKFDRLFLESEMVECGVKIIKENTPKIFEESEGAIVFPGEKYGLHTRVFITQTGYPTYEGKEMCNGFTEYEAFPFDRKIHVVASEQIGYFQVVFKALELIDPEKFKDKQYHLPMGMVQLSDRKISSRTGVIIKVDDLIDDVKEAVVKLFKEGKIAPEQKEKTLEQIAIGAIKYSVLRVGTKQDVAFSIERSVTLEGESGVYLQYTFARTQSVLEKNKTGKELQENSKNFISTSSELLPGELKNEEMLLLRAIFQFPRLVVEAADQLAPHVLCAYLYELAKSYNLFYQNLRILDAKSVQEKQLRIMLTQAVGKVIKNGLEILGIEAPEKM